MWSRNSSARWWELSRLPVTIRVGALKPVQKSSGSRSLRVLNIFVDVVGLDSGAVAVPLTAPSGYDRAHD